MQGTSSLAVSLASLSSANRQAILESLTEAQAEELIWDWRFWARPTQIAPDDDWQTWLVLAGRGFGKTEAGAQWIRERVKGGARSVALVAETQKDLEEVMVARILAIHPPDEAPTVRYKPVRLTWPNGAVALGYNGTEPNQLRGPEFDTAWVDELAKYRYARETWDMLQFTMRSGIDPRVMVTTTPRPLPVIREILDDPTTRVTRGATYDNAANLPPQYLARLETRYEGTRLGRQELFGEVLDDAPGALWTRDCIDALRVRQAPDFQRVVVAIDPSGTSGDGSGDDVGIVVAGKGVDGRAYVLADLTCQLPPAGWARRAVEAYREHRADRIIAERNYGGAMVEAVIRTVDPKVPYREVVASRGKVTRAEPVAALYEQGRVSHLGAFPQLEDELCAFTPSGYVGGDSPNRADALVWALTDLMLGDEDALPVTVNSVVVPAFQIPAFWARVYALDIGKGRNAAALWAAVDDATDTIYAYAEHVSEEMVPTLHAAAIKARGDWIMGIVDPGAHGREKADERAFLSTWRAQGLRLRPLPDRGEVAFDALTDRLATGRLKIMDTLHATRAAYAAYRRDDAGKLSDEPLMDCMRMIAAEGRRVASVREAKDSISTMTMIGDAKAGY